MNRLTDSMTPVLVVAELTRLHVSHPYVVHRRRILEDPFSFSRSSFWRQLVMGILSSQARWQNVASFLASESTILDLESPGIAADSLATELRENKIRFPNNKARRLVAAGAYLQEGGWPSIEADAHTLRETLTEDEPTAISAEREMAGHLAKRFDGISHKQARNVWINLGLFRYEFPLDSRWMGFLRTSDWGISAGNLQNLRYYLDVEDRVQAVARAAGVLPVILDSVVFAHMERVESLPSG